MALAPRGHRGRGGVYHTPPANNRSGDASAIDLDGDGWRDLYLLNMQGDDHFYLNAEGKRFEDASADFFPNTPWGTMGVEFLDFDTTASSTWRCRTCTRT